MKKYLFFLSLFVANVALAMEQPTIQIRCEGWGGKETPTISYFSIRVPYQKNEIKGSDILEKIKEEYDQTATDEFDVFLNNETIYPDNTYNVERRIYIRKKQKKLSSSALVGQFTKELEEKKYELRSLSLNLLREYKKHIDDLSKQIAIILKK